MRFRVGDQVVCKTDCCVNDKEIMSYIHAGGVYKILRIANEQLEYYVIINDVGRDIAYHASHFRLARKEKLQKIFLLSE